MKIPVYLYTNLFEVLLDLDNNNRINRIMYQRDLKLQKGVKNKIQIQFKNSDQKFLPVLGKQFVFVIFDTVNQRNVIEKNVTILDDGTTFALRGLGEVVFSESDLNKCESVYYKFGVKELDTDGSYVPTYANTYYGVDGTLEVRHDLYPTLIPSQEVKEFERKEFQMMYNGDQSAQRYEYYSGNLHGNPEFKSNSALHTAAVYMTAFKGTVLVEGTLENSPSTFGNYAVIARKEYNAFTGIDYINFNGVFSKVRFRYIPATEPVNQVNNDTNYAGTVDKIMYRS